ncbi:MAG: 30S ribosomal protein S17 [Myxococcales bacterium]|nr:30S ribosomal protein S17 [Myxococcales bacterium]|tara:strand:+ start:240 stop:500 length:261 start_codon:yes stop_codon:yes gene_type:complete
MSERGYGRTLQGVVVSNKADKTITVEITRTVRHPRYNKFIKRRAKYHAHDEANAAGMGDTVIIVEASPYSRTKRWRLQQISEKAQG